MVKQKPIAAIYARVSTQQQVKVGNGISSQVTTCQGYAESQGYEVVEVFTDSMTGRSDRRDGFEKLKQWIRETKGRERVIIFDAISRLARDVEIYTGIRNIARRYGASFASPTFQFSETPAGRFMETLHAGMGQFEAETNAETVVRRQTARLLEGHWCFAAPLGYKSNGKNPIEPDSLAGVVREALEGFASGRFETQAAVKRFIEEQPEYKAVRKSPLGNDRVNAMLRNVLYAGYVEHEGRGVSLRRGVHQPLISMSTFKAIRSRLEGRKTGRVRADRSSDFPLRGHVVCAECGHKLTACWSVGKNKKKPFPYYYCYRAGCSRKSKIVSREAIEKEFTELLAQLQPSEDVIEVTRAMLKGLWEHNRAATSERRRALEGRRRALRKDKQKIVDRLVRADSEAVIAAYENRISELEHEEAVLKEKLDQVETEPADFEEMFKHTIDVLSRPCDVWKKHDHDWKQAIIKAVFADHLTYCHDSGLQTPKTTFVFKVLQGDERADENLADRVAAIL